VAGTRTRPSQPTRHTTSFFPVVAPLAVVTAGARSRMVPTRATPPRTSIASWLMFYATAASLTPGMLCCARPRRRRGRVRTTTSRQVWDGLSPSGTSPPALLLCRAPTARSAVTTGSCWKLPPDAGLDVWARAWKRARFVHLGGGSYWR
jgi:hypothetical protein